MECLYCIVCLLLVLLITYVVGRLIQTRPNKEGFSKLNKMKRGIRKTGIQIHKEYVYPINVMLKRLFR